MPLKVSDGMGAWIDDFKKSDAPQFKGKSDKERRDQAIAAYMSAKNESVSESTDAYGKSQELEKKKRLTTNDQDKLARLRRMMDREKTKVTREPKGEYDRKVGSYLKKKYNKEDVEQVDELSQNTLRQYHGKSALDIRKKKDQLNKGTLSTADHKKAQRRVTGINRAANKMEEFSEETTFEVEVEGLPTMYVKAKSPGEVKANLRKIVKQPSMITGVSRVTDADMKKVFRDKAQGRDKDDDEGVAEGTEQYHAIVHKVNNKPLSTHRDLESAKDEWRGLDQNQRQFYKVVTTKKAPKDWSMKSEGVAEGFMDTVLRKAKVKTTKGKPNMKDAPRWASALGKTPQGAWHWLQKDGPVETDNSDKYFPRSGKTQFTGFVSEGLTEKDEREYGYEGDMAISQLKTIIRHADHMMGMLKEDTDLPEWVQSKITLATDYMQTAHDYMMSEMTEGTQQKLRKYVPGYAKKQINKKMDDQKFGRTDVDKDVNFGRYKKVYDKLKKEDVDQLDELKKSTLGSYVKQASRAAAAARQNSAGQDDAIKTYVKRTKGIGNAVDRLTKEELDEVTQGKSYTQAQLHKKIQSGNWEATHDIKPGKHVEMRHHTGKRVMVHVKEDVEEGMKPDRKAPGWMLRADPKLKAKVDANKAKQKEFKKLVGTKKESSCCDKCGKTHEGNCSS